MIIIKNDKDGMRSSMREEMRRGHYRHNDDEAYREGYKHGWEDKASEEEEYRSRRY